MARCCHFDAFAPPCHYAAADAAAAAISSHATLLIREDTHTTTHHTLTRHVSAPYAGAAAATSAIADARFIRCCYALPPMLAIFATLDYAFQAPPPALMLMPCLPAIIAATATRRYGRFRLRRRCYAIR